MIRWETPHRSILVDNSTASDSIFFFFPEVAKLHSRMDRKEKKKKVSFDITVLGARGRGKCGRPNAEHIHAKKGAKLMIESIRARFPNVLNTNQPDVCNIILFSTTTSSSSSSSSSSASSFSLPSCGTANASVPFARFSRLRLTVINHPAYAVFRQPLRSDRPVNHPPLSLSSSFPSFDFPQVIFLSPFSLLS